MAELFLAQEPPRPDLVVIKRILPYLSEEPEFVQMFLDEARIAAQLHHPNIVQVFELGKLDESIFIAMEYLEGVDLRRILAEETKFNAAVPYAVASRICAQVAAGLEYAHTSKGVDGRPLGLIHRDVSPQNVMVCYDGLVKLVDFGIAKAGALAERSKPGVIKGKFLYLSPEQVMQERLDHRSDIFALGVMLYEITTGRSPFSRPTTEGILYAIRFESPSPPHLLRDDYPQELSRIVMKCLVKDRNQRYQRAAQVQADLEALLASGALRQSADVVDYISRLLGEEEERTVLHVPIPGGRKEAPPARRAPPAPPPPPDPDDAELRTEMSRSPGRLPLPPVPAPALGEDDEDEPTAIRTLPGRPSAAPGSAPLPERASLRVSPLPAEPTVPERPMRPLSGAARRPGADSAPAASRARKPTPVLDRRRSPPVEELEEDEELSQSVSLTPATVNVRPSSPRIASSFQDEDSHVDTQSEVSDVPYEDSTGPGRFVGDPDDDESTAGYGYTHTETGAPSPVGSRRQRLLLAVFLMLFVAIGAGAAWLFWLEPLLTPAAPLTPVPSAQAPVPETAPGAGTPAPAEAVDAPSAAAPETPAPETVPAAGQEGQDSTVRLASAQEGGLPDAGTSVAEVVAPAPTSPTAIPVVFKAPRRTDIWVGGRKVSPNSTRKLTSGATVTIKYRCPGGKPRGTEKFEVPTEAAEPAVFKVDCRHKTRR